MKKPTKSTTTIVSGIRRKPTDQDCETIRMLYALGAEIHETAVSKGWWKGRRNNGELIALVHSELSEALENLRAGGGPDDKIPAFSGVEAELADAIIRILDLACARGWRVGEAIVAKMEYNKGREWKHGGKKF